MKSSLATFRSTLGTALLAGVAFGTLGLSSASAQQAAAPAARPAAAGAQQDLTVLPPVPTSYKVPRTAWGDPDLRGTWPIDHLGGLPLQRTAEQGNRVFLTDEEFATREKRMEASRNAAEKETNANKLGMGNWVEMTGAGRRTSLLVSPANGRLPELTEEGKRLQKEGRSSWVQGQQFDTVADFDSWDRCVSRGFPASMLPFRYNNGIQVYQSPGYVVINLEMIHDARIIPIVDPKSNRKPAPVRTWMGQSLGHWEGNTLVIETTNIIAGDSASHDPFKRAASPLNMATIGAPPNNTIPTSPDAKVVERLTMTGPDTIVYEMTYTDPKYWTAPWTTRLDWQRNSEYQFFEYACHEGNVQVRNYINASRAQREKDALASAQPAKQPGTAPQRNK